MRREFSLSAMALAAAIVAAAQVTPPTDTTAPTQTNEPIYKIGGNVSAPKITHRVAAEYTREARQARYQGVCLVGLIVNAKGEPVNVHVVRPLGMGLDEKALAAVRHYKFKPVLLDHRVPVPVMITVEINFLLQ